MQIIRTLREVLAVASLAMLSGAVQAAEKLSIYAWSDSIAPSLISKFEKETGIDVTLDSYSSNEDLIVKLKSGVTDYDLVAPSHHYVDVMIREGLLKDISAETMEAYRYVDPQWKGKWWDFESRYSIPFAYGTAGFAVNRNYYQGPVDSWRHFFEPGEKAAGRIGVFGAPDEVIPAAQLYLGIEFCTESSADMQRVYQLLKKQKEAVAIYSSDGIGSRLTSGDVVMHSWWDGDSLRARKSWGANIEYAQPREGLVGWLDSWAVPESAGNVENAKLFINWISRTENATVQHNYYGSRPGVKVDRSRAVHSRINSPEMYPSVPLKFIRSCSPTAQALVDRVWTRLLR